MKQKKSIMKKTIMLFCLLLVKTQVVNAALDVNINSARNINAELTNLAQTTNSLDLLTGLNQIDKLLNNSLSIAQQHRQNSIRADLKRQIYNNLLSAKEVHTRMMDQLPFFSRVALQNSSNEFLGFIQQATEDLRNTVTLPNRIIVEVTGTSKTLCGDRKFYLSKSRTVDIGDESLMKITLESEIENEIMREARYHRIVYRIPLASCPLADYPSRNLIFSTKYTPVSN